MRKLFRKHKIVIAFLSSAIIAMILIRYVWPSYIDSLSFIGDFLNKPLPEIKLFELMIALVLIDWILK